MKTASIRAVLTLNNSHFMRNMRQAFASAKALAVHFARRPFSTTGILGVQAMRTALKATTSSASLLTNVFARVGSSAKTAFLTGSIGGVAFGAIITKITHDSIEAASALESFTTTFSVLLGSTANAKSRMSGLLDFANEKGMRLTVVAEASKNLQTLTNGALAYGKGLEFVGDTAAGARRQFGDMAVTIGRIYDAMRSGTAAGDELRSLQDAGALQGGTRRYIEGLAKIGKGADAWNELQKGLSKFTGMMDAQSTTWERRMEKFRDSIEEAQRQMGEPLIDALKPALSAATALIFKSADSFHEAGKSFAKTILTSVEFLAGSISKPETLKQPIKDALKLGFAAGANYMVAFFKAGLKMAFSSEFFDALKSSFAGLAQIVGGQLASSFRGAIGYFINGLLDGWALVKSVIDGNDPNNPMVDVAYSIQKKAIESAKKSAEERRPGSGATSFVGGIFGQKGDIEMSQSDYSKRISEIAAMEADLERAQNERKKALKAKNDVRRKQVDEMSADIGKAAEDSIKEGEKKLKEGAASFFSAISSTAKNFKVEDLFGASEKLVTLKKSVAPVIAKGKEAIEGAKGPSALMKRRIEMVMNGELKPSKPVKKFSTAATLSRPTMVEPGIFSKEQISKRRDAFKSAMSSGATDLGAKPTRETPWLKKRERIALDNLKVAQIMAVNGGINPRANGAVRRGDRQRMQAAIREKMREKEGVDRTNAILTAIQVRFDELVGGK